MHILVFMHGNMPFLRSCCALYNVHTMPPCPVPPTTGVVHQQAQTVKQQQRVMLRQKPGPRMQKQQLA